MARKVRSHLTPNKLYGSVCDSEQSKYGKIFMSIEDLSEICMNKDRTVKFLNAILSAGIPLILALERSKYIHSEIILRSLQSPH